MYEIIQIPYLSSCKIANRFCHRKFKKCSVFHKHFTDKYIQLGLSIRLSIFHIYCSNHEPLVEFGLLIWNGIENYFVVLEGSMTLATHAELLYCCFQQRRVSTKVRSNSIVKEQQLLVHYFDLWNNSCNLTPNHSWSLNIPDSHPRTAFSQSRQPSVSHMSPTRKDSITTPNSIFWSADSPYALKSFSEPLH